MLRLAATFRPHGRRRDHRHDRQNKGYSMPRSMITALIFTFCFAGAASADEPTREKDGVRAVKMAPVKHSDDMAVTGTTQWRHHHWLRGVLLR
jgi:hypothetical protein